MPLDPAITQCIIVDDHLMLLNLLVAAVRGIPGLAVAATGTDVTDAVSLAALDHIDLIIVDRRLPSGDGMDLVRAVRARHPGLKCIVIAGCVKDFVCPADLLPCVVSVIDKAYSCDMLFAAIAKAVGRSGPDTDGPDSLNEISSRLTPRELELFVMLGEGLSNKELGKRLRITTRTVETHRKGISKKLSQSGAALVRLATLYRQSRSQSVFRVPSSTEPSR